MTEQLDNIIVADIEDEMKRSYLDFAMSVIIGRALPDVRDGLKPVHRRVLFSMLDLGNTHDKPYKKSARVVGDVIGKYHPHGDTAVYDTMVRMAQDFTMRYQLVEGQGNFGSIDGDPPAAMRYTEVRMNKLVSEMLVDIDKETVDFVPNYDNTLLEPSILPARFPNLLVNGSSGIAVGMATNIPPHNLTEVINALIELIKHPNISIDDIMKFIPGPDFPTGAYIYGVDQIRAAYETGRGVIKMRGRVITEKAKGDRQNLVITELPYMVNKAKLVERIAELVNNKEIDGISDVRDESDREGLRVVVELKKDAYPEIILNKLYKHTQLAESYGIILLAIDLGQPVIMNIKTILNKFIEFRKEIVTRRTIFELRKAEDRLHIIEGLKKAIENIDEVIATIKKSKSTQEAEVNLIKNFDFTQIQAKAILEMRLQRLTALETEKLVEEFKELTRQIKRLKEILGDERELMALITAELEDIRARYGDERRTEIISETKELNVEDLIADEDMILTVSNKGYIKRNPVSLYKVQNRGGKGKTASGVREEDFIENIFVASAHSYILFFTDKGRVYWLKVHEVPQAGRIANGKPIIGLIKLDEGERLTTYVPVRDLTEPLFLVMSTKKGYIKKTPLSMYSKPRSTGIIGINLEPDDRLIDVRLTDNKQELILSTRKGIAIRFKEDGVRVVGRAAYGVKGIGLDDNDEIISMSVLEKDATVLTVTEHGYGKRTKIDQYRLQGRGGRGTINVKVTAKTGDAVSVLKVKEDDDIFIITNTGRLIRLHVKGISIIGRNTQGIKLIQLEPGEKVAKAALIVEKDEEEASGVPA
ncbi:MAG: DNA gyrase subunit A [Deltaproteobacteria bacterium]|nr:DNA gyrase subunit A [Deltaproteobacteria bacterium]MCL5792458.1 DNA gyrase subunit A [Deltaproteobacteria bacterium]